MTVRIRASGVIELVGTCPSEDAEELLKALLSTPGATVDWRGCLGAHGAVIQVLMAAKPRLLGPPADTLLKDLVEPAIAGSCE